MIQISTGLAVAGMLDRLRAAAPGSRGTTFAYLPWQTLRSCGLHGCPL